MIDDRRIEERVALSLPARWDGLSGSQHSERIEDLSLGGCFVSARGAVNVGDLMGLEIQLPSGKWLKLQGQVAAYQSGIGFGVVFNFLTEDEEQALRYLISGAAVSSQRAFSR
jgi:PilZ domain-containing protein